MKARVINMFFIAVLAITSLYAQNNTIDSSYLSPHFIERQELFKKDTTKSYDVVFFGNSITERGDWQKMVGKEYGIANRGIGGDNTLGLLSRVDDIMELNPQKVFVMIGINDIGAGLSVESIYENYTKIIQKIRSANKKTKICVQSILPINPNMTDYTKGREKDIVELNLRLKNELALQENVAFIDLYSVLSDMSGMLQARYTNDGVHLTEEAYYVWVEFLRNEDYL